MLDLCEGNSFAFVLPLENVLVSGSLDARTTGHNGGHAWGILSVH